MYWGYSNFLQVLYDIIWYYMILYDTILVLYMLFLLTVQSADTFQFTDRVGMGWPGTIEHFCNTEMLNFTLYASDIIRLYIPFMFFLNGVPQHGSFSQSGKWLKQGDPSSSIILWIIVDYFWTRDEHSLSVGWSLFLLDDSQIDHPQFYVCCFHNSLQVLPGFVQFTLERPPTETRVLRSHRCPNLFEGTGGKKQQLYQPPPMIFPWNRPNHSSHGNSVQSKPV